MSVTSSVDTSVILEWKRKDQDKGNNLPVIKVDRISNNSFLLDADKGVYTSARTVDQWKVLLLDAHIQRLAHSIHLVNKDQHKPKCDLQQRLKNEAASSRPDTPTLLDYNATYLRSILVPLIRKALKGFYDAKLDSVDKCDVKSEAKITMVIDQRADHVVICVSPLHKLSSLTCHVAIAEGMRHNPNAKSLDWVHERQRLEKLLKPPINEMILCDPATGTLYEGLSSNFFVTMAMDQSKAQSSDYKDYKLVTAPLSTVLLGTVMRLVLEVCERDSVPIEYKNPSLMGFRNGEYNGAFITSTSRLVYPISTIRDNKNIACVTDIAGKIEGATDNVGSINGNVDKSSKDNSTIVFKDSCPLIEHIRKSVIDLLKDDAVSVL